MPTVYLVRHAHAGDRGQWSGDDRLRPLSDKGQRQAAALARQFEAFEIRRILSSPYLRCVQTVQPLAHALQLDVLPEPALEEGADWYQALALIMGVEVGTVMCSQGDVIGELVFHLVGRGLVASGDARWQKASTWMLTVEDGDIRAAVYTEPPG